MGDLESNNQSKEKKQGWTDKLQKAVDVTSRGVNLILDMSGKLMAFLTLISLVITVYAVYQQMSLLNPASKNVNNGWHVCKQCATKYRCRAKPYVENGKTIQPTAKAKRRFTEFERRTVNIGNVPLEISEPKHEICCTSHVKGKEYNFCKFDCYAKFSGVGTQNKNTVNPQKN